MKSIFFSFFFLFEPNDRTEIIRLGRVSRRVCGFYVSRDGEGVCTCVYNGKRGSIASVFSWRPLKRRACKSVSKLEEKETSARYNEHMNTRDVARTVSRQRSPPPVASGRMHALTYHERARKTQATQLRRPCIHVKRHNTRWRLPVRVRFRTVRTHVENDGCIDT